MKSMNDKIEQAADIIKNSDAIPISAGAGMGVDSGLPDFRGTEGFWKSYPPYKSLGFNFYDMANPSTFSSDPRLAWGFYGHRLNLYRKTVPHSGFKILKKWIQKKGNNYFVFTSNVDGQFQKAGFIPEKIMECHGSIHFLQCSTPCSAEIFPNELTIKIDPKTMRASEKIPKCTNCGSVLRPNILMFGDFNWISRRADKQNERLTSWLLKNRDNKIVIIELGAGISVPTVRYFSDNISAKYNAHLIRINPRDYNTKGVPIPLNAKIALEKIELLMKSSTTT